MSTATDILRQAILYQVNQVNTSLPAKIVNYDYTQQKADVEIVIKKRYKDGTIEDYPIITNVPVIFPRGTNFSVHWPLSSGDLVLLVFNQRSLDDWLGSGFEGAPQDPRKFSLTDAVAIPGVIPFTQDSKAEDNENFILKFGDAKVKISEDGTYCIHNSIYELLSVLDDLFFAISNLTCGGVPIDPPQKALIDSAITEFKTFLGNC